MKGTLNMRLLATVIGLAGLALVQGCAVVTGPYVPDRSSVSSRSMVSHYDVLRQQSSGGSPLHMPRTRERGIGFFRY